MNINGLIFYQFLFQINLTLSCKKSGYLHYYYHYRNLYLRFQTKIRLHYHFQLQIRKHLKEKHFIKISSLFYTLNIYITINYKFR